MAWHFVLFDFGFPSQTLTYSIFTVVGAGTWTCTLYTEAGTVVLDMTNRWVNVDMLSARTGQN